MLFGPKDRFSGLKDPLKPMMKTVGPGLALIMMPIIRSMMRKQGIVLNPKELRKRHQRRMAAFGEAGRKL